jgi:hypothetical protein
VVIREKGTPVFGLPFFFSHVEKRNPSPRGEGTHYYFRDLSFCLRVVIIIDMRYYVKFNETR